MNDKRKKARQIISQINSTRKITKNQFSVDSQSDKTRSYAVRRVPSTDI